MSSLISHWLTNWKLFLCAFFSLWCFVTVLNSFMVQNFELANSLWLSKYMLIRPFLIVWKWSCYMMQELFPIRIRVVVHV